MRPTKAERSYMIGNIAKTYTRTKCVPIAIISHYRAFLAPPLAYAVSPTMVSLHSATYQSSGTIQCEKSEWWLGMHISIV